MSNQVSTTTQLYTTIKNADTIYTVSIRSALCSELAWSHYRLLVTYR